MLPNDMPEALAAILSEPGWEHYDDHSSFWFSGNFFVWICGTEYYAAASENPNYITPAEVIAAAGLMRRIEQAIAPVAALAQEGTK